MSKNPPVDGSFFAGHSPEFTSHLDADLQSQLRSDAAKYVVGIATNMAAADKQSRFADLSAQWDAWYLYIVRPLQRNPDSLLIKRSYGDSIDYEASQKYVRAGFKVPFKNDGRVTNLPLGIDFRPRPTDESTFSDYRQAVYRESRIEHLLSKHKDAKTLTSLQSGTRRLAIDSGYTLPLWTRRTGLWQSEPEEYINLAKLKAAGQASRRQAADRLNVVSVRSTISKYNHDYEAKSPLIEATVIDPHYFIYSPYFAYTHEYSGANQIVDKMDPDELRRTAESTVDGSEVRARLREATQAEFPVIDEQMAMADRMHAIIVGSPAFKHLIAAA